jgi:hypothetical protein
MKLTPKTVVVGALVAVGGYLLLRPKTSSSNVSPPSPVPQPVPPPAPRPPAPKPPPSPGPSPSPYPGPSPTPSRFVYPIGSQVTMRDALGMTTDVIIVGNTPDANSDYEVINADCLAGPSHPYLCSFHTWIKASQIVS